MRSRPRCRGSPTRRRGSAEGPCSTVNPLMRRERSSRCRLDTGHPVRQPTDSVSALQPTCRRRRTASIMCCSSIDDFELSRRNAASRAGENRMQHIDAVKFTPILGVYDVNDGLVLTSGAVACAPGFRHSERRMRGRRERRWTRPCLWYRSGNGESLSTAKIRQERARESAIWLAPARQGEAGNRDPPFRTPGVGRRGTRALRRLQSPTSSSRVEAPWTQPAVEKIGDGCETSVEW